MKKIFLKCCLNKNLGDDLFLKVISDRYKNNIITISRKKYNKKFYCDNLKIIYINYFLFRCFNKLSKMLNKNNILEMFFIKESDFVVILGGSIFMESKKRLGASNKSWYEKLNKNYYILGSNVGPYYTEDFIKDTIKIFDKAQDVCLRDKKSYNLVRSCKKVRQASDIIFSLDVNKYIKNEKKILAISVINCDKKAGQIKNPNQELYEEKINEIINFFLKENYNIKLMSFCKDEGDETTINNLFNKYSYDSRVKKFFYNGNIEEILYELGESSLIIGSRFHANILGLIMDKSIIPIIYNNKTENLLNDINFEGIRIDINNLEEFKVSNIDMNKVLNITDVSYQKKDAQRQFEELDKFLERKEKDE